MQPPKILITVFKSHVFYLAINLIKLKVSIKVLRLLIQHTYHFVRRVREASSMFSITQLRTKRKFSIKHGFSILDGSCSSSDCLLCRLVFIFNPDYSGFSQWPCWNVRMLVRLTDGCLVQCYKLVRTQSNSYRTW